MESNKHDSGENLISPKIEDIEMESIKYDSDENPISTKIEDISIDSNKYDSDENLISPKTEDETKEITVLSQKSRKKYNTVYENFMDWRNTKQINSFSENVLLAYFDELTNKYKSTSLWAQYSMLKTTLSIRHGINIQYFSKLHALLKRKSEGYQPKKSKTFTSKEINTFLKYASDNKYLAIKVALIMGIMGALRTHELHDMKIQDCEDIDSIITITVPATKTKQCRKFTITGDHYEIVKKYISLRPPNGTLNSFFLNYQKGKCNCQNIGINKFARMGKDIALFLKLPNANMYTGHCFRKSSETVLLDIGDITGLNNHDESKSKTVPKRSILIKKEIDTDNKIYSAVQICSSNNSILNNNITTEVNSIQNNNVATSTHFFIINYGTINVFVNKEDQ